MKDTKNKKLILRKELKNKINSFSFKYIVKSNNLILENILNLEEYKNSKVVFTYVSVNREIDTKKLIKIMLKEGKKVLVPFTKDNGYMEAKEIKSFEDLSLNKIGLLEPSENQKTYNRSLIDFSIIPCLSSNYKGNRLGYGGGYYDRFFEKSTKNSAILCREKQIIDNIPMDKFDKSFPIIITEEKIVRVR